MDVIIFDLDGVLMNSMPTRFQAGKQASAKIAGLEISECDVHLLKGARGMELVEKLFEHKNFSDDSLVRNAHEEKPRRYKSKRSSEPLEGVRDMIDDIKCARAVVSGSTRNDVETLLKEAFGIIKFNVIITADDVKGGKPYPWVFLQVPDKMKVELKDAMVVENGRLGAMAANSAGIACHVALNNTPLTRSDIAGVIPQNKIFENTCQMGKVLCR